MKPVLATALGEKISNAINEWIESAVNGALKWVIDILKTTIGLLNTDMKEVTKFYNIFLALATSLVIVVVLARIVMTLVSEAEETTDATWANIVIDSIKSAISIPIMVFLQGFIIKYITIPFVKYSFNEAGGLSSKTIHHASDVATSNGSGYGYGVPILILGFFLVVLVVFFFKIGIFFADLAFYNISIPLVAVSIATESFDYFSTWWKNLIYVNVTIIAQTGSLALMVASFSLLDKGWGYLAFTIGFGFLIINAPTIVQNIWQSTGIGKATGRMSMGMVRNMFRK